MSVYETRIINKVFHDKEKGTKATFHHFILEEENNNLDFYYRWEGELEKITKNDMHLISFPMEYVPQYVGMLMQAFGSEKNPEPMFVGGYKYRVSAHLDERYGIITSIALSQREIETDDIVLIDLEWNTIEIPWDVTKRVMPESLAWLIANLKEVYNEKELYNYPIENTID